MMASLALDRLPADIQTSIFKEIWEASPLSAAALSATCRGLNDIGTPFMYRYLTIRIETPEKLVHDVDLLMTTSLGSKYLRHARHLKLLGGLHFTKNCARCNIELESCVIDDDSFKPGTWFALEESFKLIEDNIGAGHRDEAVEDDTPYVLAWKPFIVLLESRFQHLQDIIWEPRYLETISYPSIAPFLVPTLHQYHPSCKLHLRNFRFLTLDEPSTSNDELVTACSPCLHSLSVIWKDPADGSDDHNEEAAMSVLTLAPNLQHFGRLNDLCWISPHREVGQLWTGFIPQPDQKSAVPLQSLAIRGFSPAHWQGQLEEWNQAVDFQSLREWSLSGPDADMLNDLATAFTLRELKVLSIDLTPTGTVWGEYRAAIRSFLKSLPDLDVIRVSGLFDHKSLRIIAQEHGSSLTELVVQPQEEIHERMILGYKSITMIGKNFPNLTTLGLLIEREIVKNREIRCYQALSQIKQLREIQLLLNSHANIIDVENHEAFLLEDLEVVRGAIISCARDEMFALSIWEIITGFKDEFRLTSLSIKSSSNYQWPELPGVGNFNYVHCHISRSYKIIRRTGAIPTDLDIIEIDYRRAEQKRRAWDGAYTRNYGIPFDQDPENRWLFTVMKKLWGPGMRKGGWRSRWKSFPLPGFVSKDPNRLAALESKFKQRLRRPSNHGASSKST